MRTKTNSSTWRPTVRSTAAIIFIGSASKRTTEFSYVLADHPAEKPKVIVPRRNEIEYYPEHREDLFYIRTNDGAKEFRVVTAPVSSPETAQWHELVSARPGVKIEEFQPFKDYAVVTERADALPRFEVYDFATRKTQTIPLPEAAYDAGPDHNAEFDAGAVPIQLPIARHAAEHLRLQLCHG